MKNLLKGLWVISGISLLSMGYAEQSAPTIDSPKSPLPTDQPSIEVEHGNPLSGTFDITTNYMFRGISNSNNLPAFQGGLTYSFVTTGIYFNLWGSNIYQTDIYDNTGTVEIDTIAGIANDIGQHFHYDINIDRYNYPKARGLNYNELIANAQFYFVTAQIGYSSNVYNSHSDGTYYNVGIKYDIPPKYFFKLNDVTFSGGIGHYSLPRDAELYSYNDYNLLISKTIGLYTLAIQWTDTTSNTHQGALAGSKLIGTVAVNF